MLTGLLARFAIGRVFQSVVSKTPQQIWAALAVAVLLGVIAWQINDRAYDRGFAKADEQWRVVVIEERARQDKANREAARLAAEEIARLNEAKGARDATIARIQREAASDPDAGRVAIGVDSVRRLNQVD